MTESDQPENVKPDNPFKDEVQNNPYDDPGRIDPREYLQEDGSTAQSFDEFLKSFDEEIAADDGLEDDFGTLKASEIPIGRSGLQPPELEGALAPDEVAFGISEGELRAIVSALALLLKHRPAAHRRVRLTINPDGVTWHANEGNAFIEYFSPGRPLNLQDGEFRTVIIALADLHASARAAREIATFRIRNQTIRFSAKRFSRPIQTYPSRSFIAHTDSMRLNVDVTSDRPEISAQILRDALTFLYSVAPREDLQANLNLIEIRNGTARAVGPDMAGQVEASAFEGLNMTFKPRFLRWVLPAMKLRATFQIWHGDKFCIIKNDQLTFGFELVATQLRMLPLLKHTDTLLIPSTSLRTFVQRSFRMFGPEAKLAFHSDDRGAGTALSAIAGDNGQTPRRLSAKLTANREGAHIGPMNIRVGAPELLQALRMSAGTANTEVSILSKAAILIDNTLENAKYSAVLMGEIERL